METRKTVDAADREPDPAFVKRCRELLGHEADHLSDKEVASIWQHARAMASVLIELYLDERTPGGNCNEKCDHITLSAF